MGQVPWGTHLCHFYGDRGDLIEMLVPYYRAGLLNNEQCLWITCPSFLATEARVALRAVVGDVEERERCGQLQIIDHEDWQQQTADLTTAAIVERWLAREADALARGYRGLRISGNAIWRERWEEFERHEAAVQRAFHGRHIIALCSYALEHCGPSELVDVLRHHHEVLARRDGSWQVVESATAMLASTAPTPSVGHAACFYEHVYPAERIATYLREGLDTGHGGLLIATFAHQVVIRAALAAAGVDVDAAVAAGHLVVLDADAVLAELLADGFPDAATFDQLIGAPVHELLRARGRVRGFGEVVDLLCRAGRLEATFALEAHWNRFLVDRPVEMLCGYHLVGLDTEGHGDAFERVCDAHAHVVPADRAELFSLPRGDDRLAAELRHKERVIERLGRLQRVTSALSEAATLAQIATVAVTEIAATIDADQAVLAVPMDQGERLRLLAHAGIAPEVALVLGSFPATADLAVARVFRSGQAEWRPSIDLETELKILGQRGPRATVALPLVRSGEVLGVIAFGFATVRGFGTPERALHEDLARQLSLALDRARQFEDVRTGRDRSQLLANLSVQLSAASRNLRGVLDGVIAAVTEQLADSCVIHLESDDEPGRTPERLAEPLDEPSRRSRLSVPLRGAGGRVGTLVATRQPPAPGFSARDEDLLCEIGQRSGLFIENALLFDTAEADRRRAEDANRAKDEFLAMLGHELRNPLSPIVTALELMRLRGGDAFVKERTVLERQVRHMTRLVDDLLDVSRITRARIILDRRPIALADVIASAIETASPLLEERAHLLQVSIEPGDVRVDGDPERLSQALANIITNAAKYTHPEGRILVRACVEGEHAVVLVRDNGIGIEPELLPRLFDLFVQGRRGLDRRQGGLGLGLAIVRSLVEMHGGQVSVRSDGPGRGSELRVELPLASAAALPAPSSAAASAPARRVTAARRILVVDDNQDAARLLAEALAARGHDVRIAHDGAAALALARGFLPEIALLDIGLPVMDGHELARHLRVALAPNLLRLVALTGYGQAPDRRQSERAGFDEHLVKPVAMDELEPLLERLVGAPGARVVRA